MSFRLSSQARSHAATASRQSKRQHTGENAEALLKVHHDIAAAWGLAKIDKRATPVRILSVRQTERGPRVDGFIEESPGVDYVGVIRGGQSIYAEAKACNEGVLALECISENQWDEMERVGRLNALRFLLVVWTPDTAKAKALVGPLTVLCVLPWRVVTEHRNRTLKGQGSIPCEVLAAHVVRTQTWLESIVKREAIR